MIGREERKELGLENFVELLARGGTVLSVLLCSEECLRGLLLRESGTNASLPGSS